MELREHLRQALESISDHPRRLVASAIGVFWGTAAILVLTSSATGFREFMKDELSRFGRGAIAIHPMLTSSGFPGYRKGVQVELSRTAVEKAERGNAELVEAILPEHRSRVRVPVEFKGRMRRLDLSATDARYAYYRNFQVEYGRFYDERDVAGAAAVAVLGPEAAKELFESGREAVGNTIRVDGRGFEVIGVTRSKGRQYFNQDRPENQLLMIPVTAAEERFEYREEAVSRLLLYPRRGVDSAEALRAVRASLGPEARFHPDDADALRIFDFTRFTGLTDLFYAGFMVFIGIAGTITLLVAGVGIANYQLAILEERTVEIGVAKAIGARNRTMVLQTVFESLLVSGSAALAGALLGLAVIACLAALPPAGSFPRPIFSALSGAVVIVATTGVAAVAALIPALRVSAIDVSVALRAST
jgi:putative ABC transport system permease protein